MYSAIRLVFLIVFFGGMMAPVYAQQTVTPDTFIRAETDRMFRDIAMLAGGLNRFHHIRTPTPLDQQTVIRMNRDTLYSGAVIDVSGGATITFPKIPDGRYASVLIIDNDHYAPIVFYEPGVHDIPRTFTTCLRRSASNSTIPTTPTRSRS